MDYSKTTYIHPKSSYSFIQNDTYIVGTFLVPGTQGRNEAFLFRFWSFKGTSLKWEPRKWSSPLLSNISIESVLACSPQAQPKPVPPLTDNKFLPPVCFVYAIQKQKCATFGRFRVKYQSWALFAPQGFISDFHRKLRCSVTSITSTPKRKYVVLDLNKGGLGPFCAFFSSGSTQLIVLVLKTNNAYDMFWQTIYKRNT